MYSELSHYFLLNMVKIHRYVSLAEGIVSAWFSPPPGRFCRISTKRPSSGSTTAAPSDGTDGTDGTMEAVMDTARSWPKMRPSTLKGLMAGDWTGVCTTIYVYIYIYICIILLRAWGICRHMICEYVDLGIHVYKQCNYM